MEELYERQEKLRLEKEFIVMELGIEITSLLEELYNPYNLTGLEVHALNKAREGLKEILDAKLSQIQRDV